MLWGYSSAGRAPALHAGGQRFDPAKLHHIGYKLHWMFLEKHLMQFFLLFYAK